MFRHFTSITAILLVLGTVHSLAGEPICEHPVRDSVIEATTESERPDFYRVLSEDRPSSKEVALEEARYGARLLYTGDVKKGSRVLKPGTVWHSTLDEGEYYLGTRNPLLDHAEVLKELDNNKWAEAKLIQQYAPGTMARTENLGEVFPQMRTGGSRTWSTPAQIEKMSIDEQIKVAGRMCEVLRKRYPGGYFLKTLAGFDSDGTLPTDKTDCLAIMTGYLKELKPKLHEAIRTKGADEAHFAFKHDPYYEGRVIDEMMFHPENVIVQERLNPATGSFERLENGTYKARKQELRMHSVDCKVVRGATVQRWEDHRFTEAYSFARAEDFFQKFLDRLPRKYCAAPFAADIMSISGGGWKIIELNAGGESGFLYPVYDLWTSQVFARAMNGGVESELQTLFRRFDKTNSLTAKRARFKKIMAREEVQALKNGGKDLGDYALNQLKLNAKNSFMRAFPYHSFDAENAVQFVKTLAKFDLTRFLNTKDVYQIAASLRGKMPVSEIEKLLGLPANENLIRISNGDLELFIRNYDDRIVEERLLALLKGKPAAELPDAIDHLLRNEIVTRSEILKNGELSDQAIRNTAKKDPTATRHLYIGKRAELRERLLKQALAK